MYACCDHFSGSLYSGVNVMLVYAIATWLYVYKFAFRMKDIPLVFNLMIHSCSSLCASSPQNRVTRSPVVFNATPPMSWVMKQPNLSMLKIKFCHIEREIMDI